MIKVYKPYFLIALLGIVLFVPFIGMTPLFDWDEINFAESAREMILTGEYFKVQVNFNPFWEKPPLFLWLQVLCMKLFGINEFAARFPNAMAGIATLLLVFHIGKKYFSNRLGLFWVLCFLGSITPHLYFKSGIIDPVFNLFIFCGYYMLFKAFVIKSKTLKYYVLGGLFLGLALLTKGPAAVLITMLCALVLLVIFKFKFWFSFKQIVIYSLMVLLVSFAWFGVETIKNGPFFLSEFIAYQIDLFLNPVASHGQPFYYHFVVLLIGCFPISVIALMMFQKQTYQDETQKYFVKWMAVLFFVVLILFSIVKTKIVHYSSLCYFPLTFLAAYALDNLYENKLKWKPVFHYILLILGLALSFVFIVIPLSGIETSIKEKLLTYINDPFAQANFMIPVKWNTMQLVPGFVFLYFLGVSIIRFLKKKHFDASRLLLFSTLISVQLILAWIVPSVEKHTQGAAIDFWKAHALEDVYIQPLGYDSYAHYFYGKVTEENRQPKRFLTYYQQHKSENPNNVFDEKNRLFTQWLLEGNIDKTAYFCCHIAKADEVEKQYSLKRIGKNGGFVFFERNP